MRREGRERGERERGEIERDRERERERERVEGSLLSQQCFSLYLWVDFHGEEEPEVSVWRDGVKLLLEVDQPLRGQVHVLQQHPAPSLRR